MEIKYEHNKTKDEAYKAIDGFLGKLVIQYQDKIQNYSKNWNPFNDIMDFSLDAMGREMSGKIQLYDNLVVLEGNVPLLARPFLKSKIKKELEKILS
ncbi:MAG: polyhydroxyalkanoic acid system family protein [Nanoarchaeota archaeon]|nr:polyhydroxyalkanoic acid system family protein [Nanoarchaeota archaeon]